ncbi:MAG: DUF192 domain-containing protein [Candidatus Dormibacteraceae bacterium]
MLLLRHEPTGSLVVERVLEAAGPLDRGLGLLGRRALDPGTGMWIHPCKSIHMFGMRFSIDALFLDRDHRVVRVVGDLRPWRMVPLVWRAASVVEVTAGRAAAVGIAAGDQLRFEVRYQP